jgi:hypothetical protein
MRRLDGDLPEREYELYFGPKPWRSRSMAYGANYSTRPKTIGQRRLEETRALAGGRRQNAIER